VLLVTPKKKQVITFGGETKISATTRTNFEVGITNNDINTFSAKDKADDVGYAMKFGLIKDIR